MWGVGYHGRRSAFLENQRLLFAVGGNEASIDMTMQRTLLMEVMVQRNCRGVAIADLDNREALLAVRAALQQTCTEDALLSRTHFLIVASTPTNCPLEAIASRVKQARTTLQLQQLDMLLLQAQTLPGSSGIHARKRAVLEAWEHMMVLQQAGLVQHIGVCDLAVQDVEFLLTAYPDNPPEAWSIEVQLPGMAATPSDRDVPLEDVTGFAHAHGIVVLARFPIAHLSSLEPQELQKDWEILTQHLAERHRERPFKFLVTHENEGTAASFHMESHALNKTTALQTPLQIAARYLLQRGLVVIPHSIHDLQGSDQDDKEQQREFHEIFGPLAHSFTAIHPSCSPHKMNSSLLTRDDLAAIERALPLRISFPSPAPPRTPIVTTGRPGSKQDRRMYLPAALNRPPTSE